MGRVTPQGYIAESYTDILEELEDGFKRIYGTDIQIDADDPDGQLIGLIAQMRADNEDINLAVYQATDPDNSTGAWLEKMVAFAGLKRRAAQYSYLRDVALTGDADAKIPAGVIVRDSNDMQWINTVDVTLDGDGNGKSDFRSSDTGAYSVVAGTELAIVTIVKGWDSATAENDSEEGEEEETDPELLARFYVSRAKPSTNCVDGTLAEIYTLTDVRSAVALENRTGTTDTNGVEPYTVNYVVDGGENRLIGEAIYRKWNGSGLQGSVNVPVKRYRGKLFDVKFDRPAPVDISASITVRRRQNFTYVDTQSIIDNLVAMYFDIGEPVYTLDVAAVIDETAGIYVTELLLSRDGEDPKSTAVIDIAAREQARFLSGNITITVEGVENGSFSSRRKRK
jgi:uncharacterized phage protein gp47/JayE